MGPRSLVVGVRTNPNSWARGPHGQRQRRQQLCRQLVFCLVVQQLLEILCGGNLNQACMSCNKQIVVSSASVGPYGFDTGNMHKVIVHPYLPRMFFCGETLCVEESERRILPFYKWLAAVCAAFARLAPNRCDFCFKLSEKVHR